MSRLLAFTTQDVRFGRDKVMVKFLTYCLVFLLAAMGAPEQGVIDEENQSKVSAADVTLKSATLPRRKIGR